MKDEANLLNKSVLNAKVMFSIMPSASTSSLSKVQQWGTLGAPAPLRHQREMAHAVAQLTSAAARDDIRQFPCILPVQPDLFIGVQMDTGRNKGMAARKIDHRIVHGTNIRQ